MSTTLCKLLLVIIVVVAIPLPSTSFRSSSSNSIIICRRHRDPKHRQKQRIVPQRFHYYDNPYRNAKGSGGTTHHHHLTHLEVDKPKKSTKHLPPTNENEEEAFIGLYIHIPYCRRRCRYCNFAIVPVGDRTTTSRDEAKQKATATTKEDGFYELDQRYLEALLAEIQLTFPQHHTKNTDPQQQQHPKKIPLQSIYFGGGTPSLAPLSTLQSIMKALVYDTETSPFCLIYNNDDDNDNRIVQTEITMEMDPGTFTLPQLQAYKDILGINRISLGVQSLDDTILNYIGRTHTRKDIDTSLSYIQQVYGGNLKDDDDDAISSCNTIHYSLDLISGLPGMTRTLWIQTLQEITNDLHPRPNHISLYDLQIEKHTVFGSWYSSSTRKEPLYDTTITSASSRNNTATRAVGVVPPLPTVEDCAFMYKYASGYLQSKGYEHYEVSSYAATKTTTTATKSPFRSRHNQIYWSTKGQWYAFGMGATSSTSWMQRDNHPPTTSNTKVDVVVPPIVRISRPKTFHDYIQWIHHLKNTTTTMMSILPTNHNDNTNKNEEEDIDNQFGVQIEIFDTTNHNNYHTSIQDDYNALTDIIMKRLRTSDGLDLNDIHHQFHYLLSSRSHNNDTIVECILKGAALGFELGFVKMKYQHGVDSSEDTNYLVEHPNPKTPTTTTTKQDYGILYLVAPNGFLYSNTIISSIFYELEQQLF